MHKSTSMLSYEEAVARRQWYLVDADGEVVGRLATKVASILRGKNNPSFSPHQDSGDFVVVVNAEKLKFTGRKLDQKRYYRHSGYPGGIRSKTAGQLVEESPETIIRSAVVGDASQKQAWQKIGD